MMNAWSHEAESLLQPSLQPYLARSYDPLNETRVGLSENVVGSWGYEWHNLLPQLPMLSVKSGTVDEQELASCRHDSSTGRYGHRLGREVPCI
jgi:hypothetical protein